MGGSEPVGGAIRDETSPSEDPSVDGADGADGGAAAGVVGAGVVVDGAAADVSVETADEGKNELEAAKNEDGSIAALGCNDDGSCEWIDAAAVEPPRETLFGSTMGGCLEDGAKLLGWCNGLLSDCDEENAVGKL